MTEQLDEWRGPPAPAKERVILHLIRWRGSLGSDGSRAQRHGLILEDQARGKLIEAIKAVVYLLEKEEGELVLDQLSREIIGFFLDDLGQEYGQEADRAARRTVLAQWWEAIADAFATALSIVEPLDVEMLLSIEEDA